MVISKKYISLILIFLSLVLEAKDNLYFKTQPWELTVSNKNGAWLSLKFKGEELLANHKGRQTIELNAGEHKTKSGFVDQSFGEAAGIAVAELNRVVDKEKNLKLGLVGHSFDEGSKTLTLKYKSGNWEINEEVTFGANNRENRIRRTAWFRSNAEIDLKFRSFRYLTYLPLKGKYFFPATFFYDTTWRQDNRPCYASFDQRQRIGDVKKLRSSGNNRVKFSIIEAKKGLSLVFFVDSRLDNAIVRYQRNRDNLKVDSIFFTRGWALPGAIQKLAGAYMEVEECSAEKALKKVCPRILKDLGFVPPKDRSSWVFDAALLGVSVEPFHGEKLSDIGPCVVPRMKQLNLNTAWLRPVQASTVRYNPIDYKICEPKIGNWADYRKANSVMHENGMRVLEDIVPHGGGQLGVLLRGQSAKVLTLTESGSVLNGWGCDFNQPDWRNYMESVAHFYVGKQNADGFRIDAPYGSKSANWRKKGFPAHAPPVVSYANQSLKNNTRRMLPALWAQTMKLENGVMPPLEYSRASLASSGGGLNMVASMRKGAKEANPQSVILLESGELPFTAAGDMHYDRDIQSCLFKLRSLTPEQFVEGLSLWLEEQQYIDAPGAIRMRYMETGITESWPYRLWYGLEGDKAMRAMCYYIHGVPMVYECFTQGEGTYLGRLGLLRKEIKALRYGSAHYRAVKSSDPRVFTVLRKTSDESVLGLINFSPCKLKTTLTIPDELLKLPASGKIIVYDAFSGKKVAEGNKKHINKIEVNLRPFQNMLLVWLNAGKAVPSWMQTGRKLSMVKTPGNKIELKKRSDVWVVQTTGYTCKINTATGLIDSFATSSSRKSGFIMDILRSFGSQNSSCRLQSEIKPDYVKVKVKLASSGENFAEIIYTATPERLNVSINASEGLKTVFSFCNAKRWQLDSFEGMLDDIMPEKTVIRRSFATSYGKKRRGLSDRTMIWSSLECPLDWNRPEFRVFNKNGTGLTLRFNTPENPAHLYSVFDGKPGLYYFADIGKKYSSLKFSLYPEADVKETVMGDVIRLGKSLKIYNESYGWKIENDYYVIHLLRHNGVISALYAKTLDGLKKIMEKQNITADKVMVKGTPYACALMDPDSKVSIFRDGKGLRISFAGELRSAYVVGPMLRLFNEYNFNDTPEFTSVIKVRSLIGNPAKPGLAYTALMEPFSKYLTYRVTPAAGTGQVDDTSRGKRLNLKLFKNFKGRLIPQKDYSFKFAFRTDGKECKTSKPPGKSGLDKLTEDPGFEKRSLRYSLRDGKNVKFMDFELDDSLYWHADYTTRIQSGIGINSSSGLYMSWPNPVYTQNLNPVKLERGKYKLSFQLRGKIISDSAVRNWSDKLVTVHPFLKNYTPFTVKIEYYTIKGRKKIILRKIKLSKIYDWRKYEFIFDIPGKGYAPFVRISAMPEYAGEIYLDDLKWGKILKQGN